MTLTEIKAALASRGMSPLKQMGQNFLHDQNLAIAIAKRGLQMDGSALNAGAAEGLPSCVVEIGPGLGSLTEHLLLGLQVPLVVLEKDRGMCDFLRERFAGEIAAEKMILIEGDAMQTLADVRTKFRPLVILGNLPYNISTPLLMECWENYPGIRTFSLLQREVGQRLASKPSCKTYGALSVLVQSVYTVELVRVVPSTVFYPAPEVQSIVVELRPLANPLVAEADRASFAKVVHRGFSQRRKKLSNLLPVNDDRRAEHLTPQEWVELWTAVQAADATANESD